LNWFEIEIESIKIVPAELCPSWTAFIVNKT